MANNVLLGFVQIFTLIGFKLDRIVGRLRLTVELKELRKSLCETLPNVFRESRIDPPYCLQLILKSLLVFISA